MGAAILVLAAWATAAQERDPFLDRLVGTWQGEGSSAGVTCRSTFTWEWVLADRFVRLVYRNEVTREDGTAATFEAHAYYQALGDGRYRATWFSTAGLVLPIDARVEGGALVGDWRVPDGEEGRSTYRLTEDGALEVLDAVKEGEDAWREFGRMRLRRR